jgi:hypothetical protein
MKILALSWGCCPKCKAPPIRPLPEGWSYTVRPKRSGIHRVTPHTEDCPRRFKRVFVPDVDD